MELTKYIRKPFTVEGVEITESNIAEIAELVGNLRTDDKGTQYIALNRRLVPNVGRAYPGWFMTQMGDNFRVYSPSIFKKEFVEAEPTMTFDFTETHEEAKARIGGMVDNAMVVVGLTNVALAPDAEVVRTEVDPPQDAPRTETPGPEDTSPIDNQPGGSPLS